MEKQLPGVLVSSGAVAVIVAVVLSQGACRPADGRPPSADATRPPAAANPSVELTPEEDERRHLIRHRADLAAHALEPLDREWAALTSKTIDTALRTVAKGSALTYLATDCRSRTCIASVQWPTADIAYQDWSRLMYPNYGTCSVEIVLDPRSEVKRPFRTQVVFHCDRAAPGRMATSIPDR